MASNLAGKVYLVAGAASGMGLSTARTLLSRGAQVAVCDINESALKTTLSELPQDQQDRAVPQLVDITDRASVSAFLDRTKSHFGHIDGIANFAGTGGHKLGVESVWETEPKEFDFIMDLNVKEVANVVAFLLSDEGTYVTGAAWTVDGGANA